MRPLQLTMSAFGPYAGTTEIDFDSLGSSGVYLVCASRCSARQAAMPKAARARRRACAVTTQKGRARRSSSLYSSIAANAIAFEETPTT